MFTTITVTQEDIDRGVKGSADKCPIGLAVQRAYAAGLRFTEKQGEAGLPDNAAEFQWRFDAGLEVKPFSFRVECSKAPR